MLKSKSLLVLLLLMTAAAFAATASSDGTQASAVPIKTFLRADLSLKSVVLAPEVTQPAAAKAAAFTLKTCRCSCGQPCTTNADCGPGGACGVGITCCNRTPGKNALNSVFQQKDELSSSRHPSMNALVVNCKP
jgi:hypothetical protein